jgi:hypothetical protein
MARGVASCSPVRTIQQRKLVEACGRTAEEFCGSLWKDSRGSLWKLVDGQQRKLVEGYEASGGCSGNRQRGRAQYRGWRQLDIYHIPAGMEYNR